MTSDEQHKEEEAVSARVRKATKDCFVAALNATNSSDGAPEFEAAKAELRLARAEVDRIIEEIRNGKRS